MQGAFILFATGWVVVIAVIVALVNHFSSSKPRWRWCAECGGKTIDDAGRCSRCHGRYLRRAA
jgi:ribosomal protein L40E